MEKTRATFCFSLTENGDRTWKVYYLSTPLANSVNTLSHDIWQTRRAESEIKRCSNFIIKRLLRQMCLRRGRRYVLEMTMGSRCMENRSSAVVFVSFPRSITSMQIPDCTA